MEALNPAKVFEKKAIFAATVFIVSTVLLLLGDLSQELWADIVKWDLGLFLAAEVGGAFAGNLAAPR